VFWYDIDFEEDPYQPQKRFDGNFERSRDPFSSQPSSKPSRGQRDRPKRSVRSEYDAREPRQKFGGDGLGSRSRTASGSSSRGSGSEVYPKPARATPEASWRPAVRSRRDDDDDDYDYYDEEDVVEEEEMDRVRNGRSRISDRGGKRRSTQRTGDARQSEVASRLAELEEEAKDLEEKTLACEEKLAVVNVNQALWGRRLQASEAERMVMMVVMVVMSRKEG